MILLVIVSLILGAGVIILLFPLWKGNRVKEWTAEVRHQWLLRVLSSGEQRKRLEAESRNAWNIQTSLLLETLSQHQHTKHGQKYHFKELQDVPSFQKLHPLAEHSHYKDFIQRTRKGEEDVLVQGRPHCLIATAGTSGKPSLVPASVQSTKERFLQGPAVHLEVIHSHFPGALEKVARFTLPHHDKCSEAGIPIIPYPSVWSSTTTMEQIYSSPIPAHPAMSHHEMLYIQLLLALANPELRMIEANFSWFLRYVFALIEKHWECLIIDIRRGRLNPEFQLPLDIRQQIEDNLVPDAVRAEELQAQFRKGFHGIAKRVWPNLQVVIATESGGSDLDRQILRDTICQGVPVYSPLYCAAEALFGVNLWPLEDVPRYVLCPSSAFFEFIPVETSDEEEPCALCMQKVSEGKAYELVITNSDGLYRYRLGDVVRVTGFHNQSPIVKFLYRNSQTLNVRGERITECSFYKSLQYAVALWPGASLLNYCCAESGIMGPLCGGSDPHYEVFIALKGVRDLSEEQRYKLDKTLQEHFPFYKSFRFKGSIGPVRVHLTSPTSFMKLMELQSSLSGVPLDCIQPPRTLRYQELAEAIWKQVLS